MVVQSDAFNRSPIQTVIVAAITTNMRLAAAPGNLTLPRQESGLQRDSVVNVSQLLSVDRRYLTERVGTLPPRRLSELDEGLRRALAL